MLRLLAAAVLMGNGIFAGAFTAPSHGIIAFAAQRSSLASPPIAIRSTETARYLHFGNGDVEDARSVVSALQYATRREALAQAAASIVMGLGPSQSLAAENVDKGNSEGAVSETKVASLLKQVPTFAIVDPRGVPYFVVGEDAKLTSYFFLDYGEAKRILDVAISSSDRAIKETKEEIRARNDGVLSKEDEEEIGTNPWKSARIKTRYQLQRQPLRNTNHPIMMAPDQPLRSTTS